ncbi:hypothetical protein AHAS_Ahas17G0219600 [Arachis hypogaea]
MTPLSSSTTPSSSSATTKNFFSASPSTSIRRCLSKRISNPLLKYILFYSIHFLKSLISLMFVKFTCIL